MNNRCHCLFSVRRLKHMANVIVSIVILWMLLLIAGAVNPFHATGLSIPPENI